MAFQLTMQAYIEQLGVADYITRVVFVEQIKHHHYDFVCNKFDRIPVTKSSDAYCRLVCQHKPVKLSQYKISQTVVKAYLDIYAPQGKLAQYIRTTGSTVDNPFAATGVFLKDYRRLGLGDFEFLRIAYTILDEDERFSDTVQKWKKKLMGRYREW